MLFDPFYWVILGIGMLLSGWAAMKVRGTFAEYAKVPTRSGMTGADVARRILADHGIHDVRVEPVPGKLSDHYDPTSKTLRLSEPVYHERSIAAFGVAAHEVGHAIQHAHGYAPLKFRSAWVPVASYGGGISIFVIILSAIMGGLHAASGPGPILAIVGLALFGATTVFTLVTLPVEFDASRRALLTLENGGYVTGQEAQGAKQVLDAAALTYVAAFIASLLQLLYWAQVLGLFGSRNE